MREGGWVKDKERVGERIEEGEDWERRKEENEGMGDKRERKRLIENERYFIYRTCSTAAFGSTLKYFN